MLNFQELELRSEYRSLLDDMIENFYIPLLERAILYQRAVGFFSSTALTALSAGILKLILNGGRIQLLTSPRLSSDDINAIADGIDRLGTVTFDELLPAFRVPRRKRLLSTLIAAGCLEIKIARLNSDNDEAMFHEKLGLMHDGSGNVIAFSGSMNEGARAFVSNYEAIDVFKSWTEDSDRVLCKLKAFDSMWTDKELGISVKNFADVRYDLIRVQKSVFDEVNMHQFINAPTIEPSIPANVKLRPYQLDAIKHWTQKNYRGIFDMATGTGKTYTALAAIVKLYNAVGKNLAVIIVCPYQHLVEQWRTDIEAFGMRPIICYSASTQRNWKERLKTNVVSFKLGVKNHFCMLSTNATFSSDYVQSLVKRLSSNVLIVVDEAHNFGAEKLSATLLEQIPYRLALSATLDRHGDPEGTAKLYNYFGDKCIEYSLKNAIDGGMLTPYFYHPIVVSLNDEELERYVELTKRIVKNMHGDELKMNVNDYVKMMLIKRARIVAGASEKISKLREIILEHRKENQMLIYCGATTMHDFDYREGEPPIEEARQIDIVADMLGNELNMRVSKFTSVEPADERERIKADFAEGTHLQALIAIRCLDEGINIPSIKTAFILAGSTNPKEYVQRRGRVLRRFPDKTCAVIFDFVTLPIALDHLDQFDADVINGVKSLASREIIRIKDFAEIAENPFESDALISDIQSAYNLDIDREGDGYV
ncbi:MAG: DEAD/DEAH box helicase family protein [Selenomonadaceae bacterium]|nr:DEAD/DEAH box helicase family protein [Selenomonadaceae bacterium]